MVRRLRHGASTNITDWSVFEGIQSDIIDHLIAVASDFDLCTFQNPSGADLVRLAPSVD